MTDQSYTSYEAKYEAKARLYTEILPRNKATLFNALKAAGITLVTIEFDGSGDEGQIESVIATTPEAAEVAVPSAPIEIETVEFDTSTIRKRSFAASEYLETLVFELLSDTHPGWENNDGAFGTFIFDVSGQTITLEHNARYVATDYSEQSF